MNIGLFELKEKNEKKNFLFNFRRFFNEAFQPFSAIVQITDSRSVYSRMNDVVNEHIQNLKITVEK
jgi:hypothetical protein